LQQLAEAGLNLQTCEPADLEKIHGIGPKTARFWILWTRPDARYAALDVHILRWMRERGHKAPKQTPSAPKTYARLEKAFLAEADKRGLTPRELDFKIWQASASAANVAATRGE
jgi:thermostable 8-oxoguanine DNA glycosylase